MSVVESGVVVSSGVGAIVGGGVADGGAPGAVVLLSMAYLAAVIIKLLVLSLIEYDV